MARKTAPWAEALTKHFRQGIKSVQASQLGVEIEHFILRRDTQEAVPYYGPGGVRDILESLMRLYPTAEALPGDNLLGFTGPGFVISLEPAAQLEISIESLTSIDQIGGIYDGFIHSLEEVLSAIGCIAITAGCQPVTQVEDLKLIPKERYHLMDRHFSHTGDGGREMMRGTASVQVSIDYFSEEDFRRKIQAAYYYSPLFKLISNHASIFEGKPLTGFLKRTDIWNRVDASRCGIVPGVFAENFGFDGYANFLGHMPPIFLPEGNRMKETGFQTVAELFEMREPTEEELVHILSMAFPDVRLKNYLELRMADSMPKLYMLSYCALIKGVLYSSEGLNFAQDHIRGSQLSEQDIRLAEDDLTENGWAGIMYGRPVRDMAETMLAVAERGLSLEERSFLAPLEQVIRYGGIDNVPCGDGVTI